MTNLCNFGKKLFGFCSSLTWFLIACFHRFVLIQINPFLFQLFYFLSISCFGFGFLKILKPNTRNSFNPTNLDLFFTSVSASTVSSMSTLEMEVFSNTQLIILTILMFIGCEIFTSLMGLIFINSHLSRTCKPSNVPKVSCLNSDIDDHDLENNDPDALSIKMMKHFSVRFLCSVVAGYLFLAHFFGSVLTLFYLSFVQSAQNILKTKHLNILTFSLFINISTFASCGFVPTNENMIIFRKNSGLLLILIPLALLGNTLYPICLRLSVWFSGKVFKKEKYSTYLLNNTSEIGYLHLLPSLHTSLLAVTVSVFILIQFISLGLFEWNSNSLDGLNNFQKFIGILFQAVNSRHTGETIFDLSTIASAILVLFVVMMYLPPYTSFLPVKEDSEIYGKRSRRWRGELLENIMFSNLSYLVIFIILICITERKNMKQDPLNFSVFNIVLEVISAYGNVGFTTGYSCKRQIHVESNCQDKWYGFSGKWSEEGKLLLIVVMLFGRLKKFNVNGGRAWINLF